jgi:hypothetical protein
MTNDESRWQEIEDGVRLLRYGHLNSHDGIDRARLDDLAAKHGARPDDVRAMFDAAVDRNEFPRPDDLSRVVPTPAGERRAKPVDGPPPRKRWKCPVCKLEFSAMGSYNHLAACRKKNAPTDPPRTEHPNTGEADAPVGVDSSPTPAGDTPGVDAPPAGTVTLADRMGEALDSAQKVHAAAAQIAAFIQSEPGLDAVQPSESPALIAQLADTATYHPSPVVARAAIAAHEALRTFERLSADWEQLTELRARIAELEGHLGVPEAQVA